LAVSLGVHTDGAANAAMTSSAPDALRFGGGVEASSRAVLIEAFKQARPGRPIIEHFGGPTGLLDHLRQAVAASPS
jgi:hypothetical protein